MALVGMGFYSLVKVTKLKYTSVKDSMWELGGNQLSEPDGLAGASLCTYKQ